MHAIEFRSKIKDGKIEIPQEYWERLRQQADEHVRVIVLTAEKQLPEGENGHPDLIAELLANPMQMPGFTPLRRDETHDRH